MINAEVPNQTPRTSPRLWVETLWILNTLDATVPLREVRLTSGVNLILSPPTDESTGHGVGKTAFCQLLRFVLEDPYWASTGSLPDELRHTFPDGAVAARVHIEDTVWTVVKPWRHQRHYRAARNADWQAIAHEEVANEHAAYVAALEHALVDILPTATFPGSRQPIEWKHILAWCSRDQDCRYRDYYHWRSSGIGFPFPAKSPAMLVKMVLGLLDDADTLDKLKRCQEQLADEEAHLTELRQRPCILRDHVRHQLAEALGQPAQSPFRSTDLLPGRSLKALAEQRRNAYTNELQRCNQERVELEGRRDDIVTLRTPMARQMRLLENGIAQDEAALALDLKELERLQHVADSLQARLPEMCTPGDVLFGKCEYVLKRLNSVSIDERRRAALHGEDAEACRQHAARCRKTAEQWRIRMEPLNRELKTTARALSELDNRRQDVLGRRRRLEEAAANFETYDDISEGRSEWPELEAQKSRLRDLKASVDKLELQLHRRSAKATSRRAALQAILDAFACKLPGLSWGAVHADDPRPFRLGEAHSAALAVLEMLVGDFVCLADSTDPGSLHPGFLLHDSPREAELSAPVFWAFLTEAVGQGNAFQYIVTTSTHAPDDFRPYVHLELGNHQESDLLFGQHLGANQESLANQ